MTSRSACVAGLMVTGIALLPCVVRADIRIEERSTSLDSTVTRTTAIQGEKRAVISRADTTGVLYNAGARYGLYVEVARPDKELIWEIDPQERSYKEIPVAQFSRILQKGVQAPRSANDQPLRTLYRADTTAVEVVPTGRTRRIAGYEAEEVMARVVVGAQNLVSGNEFQFTFDQQIWLTKDPAILKEVHGFEEPYAEKFGSTLSLTQARLLAGEWSDAFITHIRALNDRVRALQGFPLAVTTKVTETAVAQAKGEKGSSRELAVASSEVRKISLESIPDSEFELPAGYINSDTKVAVAPAVPAPAPVAAPIPAAPIPQPVVVAKNPPVPAPAAPVPGPVVAAAPAPTPAAPVVSPRPQPAVASAATVPSNVIVPGPVEANPAPSRIKTTPVLVTHYTPPPSAGNVAVLAAVSPALSNGRRSAPPVTIDEPEFLVTGKKKHRH
jgi:hypothetical protein